MKTIVPTSDMSIDGRPAKAGQTVSVTDKMAAALLKQKLATEPAAKPAKK